MELHTFIGSPSGRTVEAVINHLRIPVKIHHHDFFTGELKRPDYLALNPNAMVPTLIDGSFVLWESDAIMQYLADRTDNTTLFPHDLRRRAEVVRWQFWSNIHFNRAFGTLAFETVAKPALNIGAPNAAAVATALADLAQFAPVLDGHLKGREFMVGEAMTLADYAIIRTENYQAKIPFDWSPFSNLNAYFERMRRVDAWTRTAAPSYDAIGRKPAVAA